MYASQRQGLLQDLNQSDHPIAINKDLLLSGDAELSFEINSLIFGVVHKYILETHRFDA